MYLEEALTTFTTTFPATSSSYVPRYKQMHVSLDSMTFRHFFPQTISIRGKLRYLRDHCSRCRSGPHSRHRYSSVQQTPDSAF